MDDVTNRKRVQIVEIYGEDIEDFFAGNMTVIEGLPDDIELVQTWDEPAKQCYCFMFKSEEFPVVEEGEKAPRAEITIAQRRVNQSTHWVCQNCHETHENGDVVR